MGKPYIAVSRACLTAPCILSVLDRAPTETNHQGGITGTWFWLNIPLALLFFCGSC